MVNNQTLKDFLGSVDNSKMFYWFDLKNLSFFAKLNEALLGPMVGIGVNEETYAQP